MELAKWYDFANFLAKQAIVVESRIEFRLNPLQLRASTKRGGCMRKATIIGVGVFLCASIAQAKDKERTFSQPCSVVFPIAEKLASEKPYKLEIDGKNDMNLVVDTGSYWKAGSARIVVKFTQGEDGSCTVVDNSPYSGVRRNGTVFLDRLEKQVADSLPAKP
jgi:hypothetical protein